MPTQLVIIHGGSFLSKGEDMLTTLRQEEVTVDDFKQQDKDGWKDKLPEILGNGFEFFYPEMPNWQDSQYEEWKVWFEKMIPFLHDDVMLVGHSLGGAFLAKYLAENVFPKKIRALFLVATPYSEPKDADHFVSFTLPADVSLITKQIAENDGFIFMYHSKDDPIVSFDSLPKYQAKLAGIQARVFEDRGHFIGRIFPEIVEDIQNSEK